MCQSTHVKDKNAMRKRKEFRSGQTVQDYYQDPAADLTSGGKGRHQISFRCSDLLNHVPIYLPRRDHEKVVPPPLPASHFARLRG